MSFEFILVYISTISIGISVGLIVSSGIAGYVICSRAVRCARVSVCVSVSVCVVGHQVWHAARAVLVMEG